MKTKQVSITMNLKGENVEKTSNYMALLIWLVLTNNQAQGTKYWYGFFSPFFFFHYSDTKEIDMVFQRV